MASNSFGQLFRITTWGESHGKAIGVVIDGCPAGLELDEEMINRELAYRAPGRSPYTSPRSEKDYAEILSGVFEGKSTGTPISILIWNKDFDSSKYEPIKDLLRPGHANYTYLEKYGCFDYRGGGRSSARETACRVAAGAVAKQVLKQFQVQAIAYLSQIESVWSKTENYSHEQIQQSPIFCPDPKAQKEMMDVIADAKKNNDSVGGVIEFRIESLPVGCGDPIYDKLEANLAKAMMSIPASKGFEIGSGFRGSQMRGSVHNDSFIHDQKEIQTESNHAGGVLGGISNGMPIVGRVAFKPTSSIQQPISTLDLEGNSKTFELPKGSRHDPCVAIRAVPVVEAMAALVVVDALLMNRNAKVEPCKKYR